MSQSFQSDPPAGVGAGSKEFSTTEVKKNSREGSQPTFRIGEAAAPLVSSPADTGESRVEVPEAGRLASKPSSNRTFCALYVVDRVISVGGVETIAGIGDRHPKRQDARVRIVAGEYAPAVYVELNKLCCAIEVAEARMNLALRERDDARAEVERMHKVNAEMQDALVASEGAKS
jgi:hypothetical protein